MNQNDASRKLPEVPIWTKDMTFQAWKRSVQIWAKVECKAVKKYQALIESLKKNEEQKGLKEMIITNIVEDLEFDVEIDDVVERILSKVEEFSDESHWTRMLNLAKKFKRFKQNQGEGNREYVQRFGKLEMELKNEKVKLPNSFLTGLLLIESNFDQNKKETIMATIDMENEETVLKKVKKKICDDEAVKEKNDDPKETLFGDYQGNPNYRRNSRDGRDKYRRDSRSRNQGGNFNNRQRSHSKTPGKGYQNRGYRSHSRTPGRQQRNETSHGDVKHTYKCQKFSLDTNKTIFEQEVENHGVVDTGCPEMVAGRAWLRTFENSMNKKCEVINKKDVFKFGDVVAEAEYYVKIPLKIGSIEEDVEVAIVETNVPLLFSKTKLKEWGGNLDFEEDTMTFKTTGDKIKLKDTSSGHYIIPVGKSLHSDEDKIEIVKKIFHIAKTKQFQTRELRKLHRSFGHPAPDKLNQVIKDAGEMDSGVMKKIKKIYKECKVCLKFQRKASRPKVGMPKAREINEVVSVDLKPVASLLGEPKDERQIVYLVDEFSGFTVARVSKTLRKNTGKMWVQSS